MVWLASAELALKPFVALNAEYGQSAVLAGLGHTEKNGPQHTLGGHTDRKQHLDKGQDVERDATEQNDDSSSERE